MYLILALLCLPFSLQAIEGGQLASEKQLLQSGTVATLRMRLGKVVNHCTAVRISENVVLTAAHCVSNPDKFPIGIRQSLSPLDESAPMEKVIGIAFPTKDYFVGKFNGSFRFLHRDIAILVLEKKAASPFPRISSVELNQSVLQFGYGLTRPDQDWDAFPLSYLANGKVLSEEDGIIEMANSSGAIHGGDSGGPLLSSTLGLLGIASVSDGMGSAAYVSPLPFLKWIRQITGQPDLQSHAGEIPGQYSEKSPTLMTKESLVSTLSMECKRMKEISGTDWELRSRDCFPKDEATCKKLANGLVGQASMRMEVAWDHKNSTCVWIDDL